MPECVIAKPAIDAKSYQFVLDEFGEIKRFLSEEDGVSYLLENGFSKKDVATLKFIDEFEQE